MKKILVILNLFCVWIMVGCQSILTPIEPDEQNAIATHIILDDVIGDGSTTNPYVINMKLRETFTTTVTMKPSNAPANYAYVYLQKQGEILTDFDKDNIKGVSLNSVSSKDIISITSRVVGKHYLKLVQDNIESLIQINISEDIITPTPVDFSKTLKVLAIGNSYSDDAMTYLYEIAKDYGVEEIVLGNLVVAGAELSQHVNFAINNSKAYVYRKTTDGTWIDSAFTSLEMGLTDEDWDIITIQEAPIKSGLKDAYEPYLERLVNYVHGYKTNPNAQIYWHLTWANEEGNDHPFFEPYHYNQMVMYEGIIEAYHEVVAKEPRILGVIPVGTVIQNLRTGDMGDTFTRDGYHLGYGKGRYIAGLTFFAAITQLSIADITFVPIGFKGVDSVSMDDLIWIKTAIQNAIEKPTIITPFE